MTWWPSVPTSAVIAPTIAGSSSTTRMRSARGMRAVSDGGRGGQGDHESRAVPIRRLAPESGAHGLREPPRRIQPDAGAAGRARLAPGVGLEDSFAPLLGNARALVRDADPDPALG